MARDRAGAVSGDVAWSWVELWAVCGRIRLSVRWNRSLVVDLHSCGSRGPAARGLGDAGARAEPRRGGSANVTPEYVTFSNLIIDDIVLSDGRSFMNTLGGAGTHALIGMRVWSEEPGLIASVGADFDIRHRSLLEGLGADLRGLIEREGYKTARAWQLFEPDERRIEVFRTSEEDFRRAKPQFVDIPADYLAARGFHIQSGTLAELADLVARLRDANPRVCLAWEPAPMQLMGPPICGRCWARSISSRLILVKGRC